MESRMKQVFLNIQLTQLPAVLILRLIGIIKNSGSKSDVGLYVVRDIADDS